MSPAEQAKYILWVQQQLPEITDKGDRMHINESIVQCYNEGFTKEDALAYVSLTEHVNPLLGECEALESMARIAKKYLDKQQPAILFDVKSLARAVKLACKHHEESYDGDRQYNVSFAQAAMMSVKELNLPKELWPLLSELLMHSWNDMNYWADSVLAGTAEKDYGFIPLSRVDMNTPDMMTAKKGGKKS